MVADRRDEHPRNQPRDSHPGTLRRAYDPPVPGDVQLSVRTLPGGFDAAEIDGLRPTDAADDAVRDIVRNALWEHGVACLRFADGLDDDQARAVASMIGLIKDPIGRTRNGGELRYSEDRQVIDAGFVLTDELREQLGDLSFGGLDPLRPGLDDDQARAVASMIALLQFLEDHAEAHAPRYAHRWRAHDVLMWDNATVQHKAGGDFPVGEPRRFWRYMIEGPRPVGVT